MNKLYLSNINLQRFAEGQEEPPAENPETGTGEEQGEETKTYTQEEVDELMKGLLTKDQVTEIVKDRVAREKKKAEEDKKEAERLAKLSADEREKEINDKTKRELEEAKATIRRMNLEHDTEKILIEKNIPLEFKGFLIGEDEEITNGNIKTFKELYDKAIEMAVNERFKGNAPKAGASSIGNKNPWSKEGFNLTEQGRILRETPELAQKLMNDIRGE